MRRTRVAAVCAAVLLSTAGPLHAQAKATITGVPDIPFTSVRDFLKLPPGEYLGEAIGVATDSKGNIYVGDIRGKRAQKFVRQD